MTNRSDYTWIGDDVPDDQLYTYEDIEKYSYVILNGKPGYVIDKGDHIVGSMDGIGHLLIEPYDGDGRDRKVHEKLVNRYLYEKHRLWVDWRGDLGPHTSDDVIIDKSIEKVNA